MVKRCAIRWENRKETTPISEFERLRTDEARRLRISPRAFELFFNAWIGMNQRLVAAKTHASAFQTGFELSYGQGHNTTEFNARILAVPADGSDPGDSIFSQMRVHERALFDCVVNAHSAVESLFHAIYVVASVIRPTAFQLDSSAELRRISPSETLKRLMRPDGLPNDRMTIAARGLLTSAPLSELQRVRNEVVHRGTPIGLGAFVDPDTGRPVVMLSSEGPGGPLYIRSTTGMTIAAGTLLAIKSAIKVLASTVDRKLNHN